MLRDRSKTIFAYVLLMIFAVYYVNITCFYHSHVINGATITHSHFHSGKHEQSGTHSETELTLIASLSALQATISFLFVILLAEHILLRMIKPKAIERQSSHPYLRNHSLRAPPLLG